MDPKLKKHGVISWSELTTSDVDAAKTFYGKLFGWSFEDMPMEGMTYTMARADGGEVAGIMTLPPEAGSMPPAWTTYVTVDDVDAAAKMAVALGGQIFVPPQDIPEVGRFCVISDPQGAFISMITYL
ncbi:VOC family protein [Desulfonatronovibrio hydrogenovorans]|uniref:VOC family protein n=1 Tax=Desulfonatronovibrio hydrogenovorans TaxID=53245 RepID=UPI00048AE5A3|nr:VOC family protein [Desulfonatronovibrio hydrogenovorans]